MLAQGPKVGGSIDGLSLDAAASGATPATLIRALSGTLKHPRARIDKDDLLIDSAAAWATGGLSLVADQLIQRLTAFGSPCEKVLRRDASDTPDAGPL